MMHFTVEDFKAVDSCHKCCCETLHLKPGTTTRVTVGYAPWAVPIGQLHCSPQFVVEKMDTCVVPTGGNLPPQITSLDGMVRFDTGMNVHLDGDLRTKVTDPEGLALTFKLLTLYGPKQGKIVLDPSGMFDYDPYPSYTGEERFYCSASDGVNTFTFEVLIAVGIDAGLMKPREVITIGTPQVDQRYYMVVFPVTMSPAAQECDVWRLTVLQSALDCACQCYSRTDCFDIKVAKC